MKAMQIFLDDSKLQNASDFDRVEIEAIIDDGFSELVPLFDAPDEPVVAFSVRLHLKTGGVDTARDFIINPNIASSYSDTEKVAKNYAMFLARILKFVNEV